MIEFYTEDKKDRTKKTPTVKAKSWEEAYAKVKDKGQDICGRVGVDEPPHRKNK